MEETKTKEVKAQEITHIFYCDNCKKYLGESVECDDGYYEEYGRYEQSCCIHKKIYDLNLHLCDKCKAIYNKRIVEALKNLGFKEDKSIIIGE